ncbi:MAG TPA: biopolymer transporter ExbD [Phycisphaerales bacterium]|nr:biopolymer transporter ExbD [Phycisphaerales bacterium]
MLIKKASAADSPAVDLTPIIDMVFLLLIFFLVTTTYQQVEREMRIALPEAESGAPISVALRELVVNVASDGSVVVAGGVMSLENLRALVTQAVEANPNQKVTVRADREASYGVVARVLDICKASGVSEPFLDTVPMR